MADSWFDEVITPAEQVECAMAEAYFAWAVEKFREWVTVVMPTEVASIG